tara:strand:+ start:212 stop:442 length:231 start_codon:yes stop_codon:yes gene_type:complete
MAIKTLEVYKTGTWVKLSEEVEAKIITVAIHQDGTVQYECAWWSGQSRVREWFSSEDFIEVQADKVVKNKIGFCNA